VLDNSIAALAIAEVGAGRVVGAFDRNTFFNPPGVGSHIDRHDNEIFAQNLVLWAANAPGAVPLAGDYNSDRIVDAADFTVWRDTLGQANVGLAADGNGDRNVDAADYLVWKNNFGTTWPAGGGAAAGRLPEPTCVSASVIGLICLAAFRCRRQRVSLQNNCFCRRGASGKALKPRSRRWSTNSTEPCVQ
jgi:hypothetical protein